MVVGGQHHALSSIPEERQPVLILQEAAWTSRPVWTYKEKSRLGEHSTPGPSSPWRVAKPNELCIWQSIILYQLTFFKIILRHYFWEHLDLNASDLFIYLLIYFLSYLLTFLLTYLLTFLLTYLLSYLFSYLLTYLVTYLLYLFTYLLS